MFSLHEKTLVMLKIAKNDGFFTCLVQYLHE